MEEKKKFQDSRLDLEIYIMGEMKYDFMSFLGECYKENFCETLSWGNFRRFQLTLSNKKNWINIYFVLLKNEMPADILINTFKIYEKRNLTLLFYNAFDQKSKKAIETLQESLIFDRNKFYEGILNDNSIKKNMKKLADDQDEIKADIDTETLKENLKYLTDNENNLIYRIGFYPNQTNKKTKNVKKSDINQSYDLDGNIFCFEDETKNNFSQLVNFIITEHFNKFNLEEKEYEHFLKVIVEYPKKKEEKVSKSDKNTTINYIVKSIDWLILCYILICFYQFLMN
jgi:hypothetical protein